MISIYIPYSFISSANPHLESFRKTKVVIRDLINVAREGGGPSPLPETRSLSLVQSSVRSRLQGLQLLESQIGNIKESGRPLRSVKPPIQQKSLSVEVKSLNIKQIFQIGAELHALNSGTKLLGLEIIEDPKEQNYYNVVYQLTQFSLPPAPDNSPKKRSKKLRN